MPRSVGDQLASARRAALVGRDRELEALLGGLENPTHVFTYVHGPGGVGKSALLEALAWEASTIDHQVMWVDCADCEPTVDGFTRALTDSAGVSDCSALAMDTLLVVDRLELLGELALWFWPTLIGSLPEGVTVVAAGRHGPPSAWIDDAAFAGCADVLPLRNLPPADAAALARARGVASHETVTALVRSSYGHPLAIVIGSDTARRAGPQQPARGVLLDHPDAVARLLGRFLDEEIDELHRTALHLCGHARRVDRDLLRRVLSVDLATADALLSWLRARPYAESHADGLTLHDVVRDALDRDLRWRDRAAFADLHNRIRAVVLERMAAATGTDHDRCARDLLHLHRGNPAAREVLQLGRSDAAIARPLTRTADETAWFRNLFTARNQGAAADYWLRTQPGGITVFENASGYRFGATLMARLDRAPDDVGEHDVVAAWAARELARIRPIEPDESVLRHATADDGDPKHIGPIADQMATLSFREWRVRGLGWVILSTTEEPRWAPLWGYVGFERLGTCRAEGRECGVWVRDFLRSPFADWLAQLAARELDETGSAPPPVATPVALAHADFTEAVRRLLKDLHQRDRVRRNPLAGSNLATTGPDPVDTLTGRVRAAVTELAAIPKLEPAARAIDRTFIRPAGSQEKAAELLAMPFSTYRRQLAVGVERVTALLWDWELHGSPTTAAQSTGIEQ